MEHVMHAAVVDIAGVDFDRPFNSFLIYDRLKLVKAAYDRLSIVIKLKEVGRIPTQKLLPA